MMKPSVYAPQIPEPTYQSAGVTAAAGLAAHTPFYPGTGIDPGHVLGSHPVAGTASSVLSKGTGNITIGLFFNTFVMNVS